MKPIISPIWFYLFNLFSKIELFTEVLIAIGVILTVILAIILIAVEVDGEFVSEEERKKWYGYLKKKYYYCYYCRNYVLCNSIRKHLL